MFLIRGHSGSSPGASPCLQALCLETYPLPQTSRIFATHTSRFSNKCSLKEFPGIYIGRSLSKKIITRGSSLSGTHRSEVRLCLPFRTHSRAGACGQGTGVSTGDPGPSEKTEMRLCRLLLQLTRATETVSPPVRMPVGGRVGSADRAHSCPAARRLCRKNLQEHEHRRASTHMHVLKQMMMDARAHPPRGGWTRPPRSTLASPLTSWVPLGKSRGLSVPQAPQWPRKAVRDLLPHQVAEDKGKGTKPLSWGPAQHRVSNQLGICGWCLLELSPGLQEPGACKIHDLV